MAASFFPHVAVLVKEFYLKSSPAFPLLRVSLSSYFLDFLYFCLGQSVERTKTCSGVIFRSGRKISGMCSDSLQRRPSPSFLEILQEGGASGEVFTMKEVSSCSQSPSVPACVCSNF